MTDEKIRDYIIKRLSKNHNPNDIIMELCDRGKLTWPRAEALVNQVQREHSSTIVRRQSPLLIGIGLFLFGGGAYLLVSSSMLIINLISQLSFESGDPLQNAGPVAYLAYYAPYAIPKAITGLAMMIGSMVGLKDVWAAILGD